MRSTWKKLVSTALSLALCGTAVLPMFSGTASAEAKIKIACVGDSITAGVGSQNGQSYPTQLQALLGSKYEVKNFGYSGSTAQDDGVDGTSPHGYRTTAGYYQNSLNYGADIVIIMLGTNDSKDANWKGGANHYERDLRALIDDYRTQPQQPAVLIATSPTVKSTSWTINDAVVTGEIAPLQRRVAAELGLGLIDMNEVTKGHPDYYSDGVHLNNDGYAVAAAAMQKGVQQAVTRIRRFAVSNATDRADTNAASKMKIACVGDSITAVSVDSNGVRHSYIPYLQESLGDNYEVGNFGNSGKTLLKDSANGNGYTLTDTYQKSLAFKPDIVTIMLGTNDSKAENWTRLGDQYERELRALVQTYRDLPSHPVVYLATSPTAHSTAHGIQETVLHNEIAPLQRKVAADLGCPLIEVHNATKDAADKFWDGIHPTEDGCVLLGSIFAEKIKNKVTGVIDENASTIALTLAPGTNLTALAPTLTLAKGATYTPTGAQDFTKPVTYTVTAADGTTTRAYTVTAKVLPNVKIACVGDSMTQAETYPNALEAALGNEYEVGRFGRNSTTAQQDGLKENGANPVSGAYINSDQYKPSLTFGANIVVIMIGANDSKQGDGQTYNGHKLVTNWKADSPQNYERDLKALVKSYQDLDTHPTIILATSPSGYATPGNWAARPEIVNAEIAPIQRKVAADMGCFLVDFNKMTQGKESTYIGGDGLHPNTAGYQLLAHEVYKCVQGVQAAITSFSIGEYPAVISQIDKTIHVTVPDGTDLTALTPTLTLSDGAQCNRTGAQNFSAPLTYTVTGANGWVTDYAVSVTSPSGVAVYKLEMKSQPEKTTYLLGEALDTTGAAIDAIYTDGTRKTVAVTADMLSGYDWLSATKQELTVSYEGKSTTFTVQVNPYGLLGTFSTMSGKYTVLKDGEGYLYANWKNADTPTIDLSGYGDRSTVQLELDVQFDSENPDVDPAKMWQGLTVKLRSAEVKDKEGDPDLKINGGNYDSNSEHNYGWDLKVGSLNKTDPLGNQSAVQFTSVDGGKTVHIAIPLNTRQTNKRGLMDWATVNRIIVTSPLYNEYKTGSIRHSMSISNVRIVDTTQTPATPDMTALQAAVDTANAIDDFSLYTPESAKAFEQALTLAKAYLSNPYATQEAVNTAARELVAAQQALAAKAITSGDVDENGRIDTVDALLTLQAAADKVTLTKAQTIAADVDGEAGVSAADALLILKRATGAIDTFPGEKA